MDDTPGPAPTPGEPAQGGGFGLSARDFIAFVGGALVRQGETFPRLRATGTSKIVIYLAVLLAVPQTVLFLLGMVGIGFSDNIGAGTVLSIALLGFAATAALVAAMVFLTRWIAPKLDGSGDAGAALRYVLAATVPLWVFALLGNLADPIQRGAAIVGFVWMIVNAAKGAGPLLNVPEGKRAVFVFAWVLSFLLFWIVALSIVTGVTAGWLAEEITSELFA